MPPNIRPATTARFVNPTATKCLQLTTDTFPHPDPDDPSLNYQVRYLVKAYLPQVPEDDVVITIEEERYRESTSEEVHVVNRNCLSFLARKDFMTALPAEVRETMEAPQHVQKTAI